MNSYELLVVQLRINCENKEITLTHDFGKAIPSGQSWEFGKNQLCFNRFNGFYIIRTSSKIRGKLIIMLF